jgi:hypothetical protein
MISMMSTQISGRRGGLGGSERGGCGAVSARRCLRFVPEEAGWRRDVAAVWLMRLGYRAAALNSTLARSVDRI